MRRLVRIQVTPELIADLLVNGDHLRGYTVTGGLPEGARFETAEYNESGAVTLYYEHESFEAVEPGTPVPYLLPTITVAR